VKIPRVTVSGLVVLVAVVAVNLAVALALFHHNNWLRFGLAPLRVAPSHFGYNPWAMLGLVPMGLALQVGVFQMIRRRSAFWAGFVSVGVALSASVALAQESQSAAVQEAMFFWFHNGRQAGHLLLRSGWVGPLSGTGFRFLGGLLFASLEFLPQLLAALVGAVLARQIAEWWGLYFVRSGPHQQR